MNAPPVLTKAQQRAAFQAVAVPAQLAAPRNADGVREPVFGLAPCLIYCRSCGSPFVTNHGHRGSDYGGGPIGGHPVRFCSDGCRDAWHARDRAERRRRARAGKRCAACGRFFHTPRAHALYCSNACRQSAYHSRQQA